MTEPTLSIQEVKQRTGISDHALRYYEKIGLLTNIGRLPNGHRYYTEKDVEWIAILMLLRSMGMPIRDMQVLAGFRRRGEASLEERIDYFSKYREELLVQIQRRQEAIKTIDKKIAGHRQMLRKRNHNERDRP